MVKVDKNKCIGCGICAGMCPETFQMDLSGKSEVIKNEVTDCAKKAATDCPVEAISVK
ncbi:MAG: ferredoxin [Candidatus Falkowbacteria bacterium]|nr:ferredoxin [Candidatus Falkowbacteria bacterium]